MIITNELPKFSFKDDLYVLFILFLDEGKEKQLVSNYLCYNHFLFQFKNVVILNAKQYLIFEQYLNSKTTLREKILDIIELEGKRNRRWIGKMSIKQERISNQGRNGGIARYMQVKREMVV